ncbi:MAG: MBL fold metallo-hydrolase [Vicinamibacterales bacterium]
MHRSLLVVALLLPGVPVLAQVVRTADVTVRGLTADDFPRIKKLADNIYAYEDLAGPTTGNTAFTTNSLIIVTREGVVVADGQANERQTKRLVDEIAKITPLPIKYVVIGADHADHIGGNAAFPPGVIFIAHPASKAVIERMAAGRAGGAGRGAAPGGGRGPIPIPQETVADKRILKLGDTEMQILFLGRAHTGGDLELFLPRENIMWMSEVFFNRLYPSVGGGFTAFPSEWIETIKKAEAMKAALYVPNHGFVDSPQVLNEEIVNFRRALENVVSEAKRLHTAGVPLEVAYRSVNLGEFQYWYRAANNMPDVVRKVYVEEEGRER